MKEKEATFLDAIKVWWAITWRVAVVSLPLRYLSFLLVPVLGSGQGGGLPGYFYSQFIFAALGILVSVLIIRYLILNKEFNDFKLVLARKNKQK